MNSMVIGVIFFILPIILLGFLIYFIIAFSKIHFKYKDVIELDAYKDKVKKETEKIIKDNNEHIKNQENQINDLSTDYSNKRKVFEDLLKTISLYEDEFEIISYGLYKPHYDFDTSDKYKQELDKVREKEKEMIKEEKAAVCPVNWTVNGSASQGKKQIKQHSKLLLRAFNGECDALNADVRWNNITRMEERLAKSFEAINKLGSTEQLYLTQDYYKLKLEELRLTYEYEEKKHQEKEEQRRIQEQIREEEKVQKEIDEAIRKSEEDEKRYNKALEQARKELEKAKGSELSDLKEKISQLEKELDESKLLKERALSRAQQTKAGHVYIISNIGSFGENVFKIGMTRRLEPMDRVRELGDASVPFNFDVHAMIETKDAPTLENNLHKIFDNNKINLINERREFFKVSIDEIEKSIKEYNSDVNFIRMAEAREFRESEAMRIKLNQNDYQKIGKRSVLDSFPDKL
ncbi:MAG: DUF4041 domain-containing protein [Brevinematales bacterium]|jgi:hypothetical protein